MPSSDGQARNTFSSCTTLFDEPVSAADELMEKLEEYKYFKNLESGLKSKIEKLFYQHEGQIFRFTEDIASVKKTRNGFELLNSDGTRQIFIDLEGTGFNAHGLHLDMQLVDPLTNVGRAFLEGIIPEEG